MTAKDAEHFSIVLPPPNVTGTLHMGHAATLAIEDVMVRYHRMKGAKTLWLPGTDHAAVATESKVENKLIKEEGFKKPKEELGREEFLKRVKKFAQDSHDTIVNQCKKMGASLDLSREAYTFDEQRNLAVRTVFKKMYDDGLIYRGYRVINWSVKGQSTCSDDELVHVERPAKLYYFKYSKDFPITIATTRPETKLGDTAVAVNPNDERYQKYIGKTFTVDVGAAKPLNIKIITDENVDKDFGTGALGVTPAHSVVDFEMYQKQKAHNDPIELIQVIGEDGRMTAEAGKDYVGLTVEEAREKFVAYLKAKNLVEKEEDIVQNVGTSDRFGDVVEALPKTQWFVDVNKKISDIRYPISSSEPLSLKEMMRHTVNSGDVKIIPDRFEKIYFNWINNLRDWCISRQIWFGHQIPVWYCVDGEELKIKNQELKSVLCGKPIASIDILEKCVGCGGEVRQDPDTLDTWFSAGLWTFSAFGYPNETLDLKNFHPTSVLETGYDILFFWVARMILMTTYTLGVVPFKTVYLHGLVRDEKGKKMSKSLGNIIDPLDMIEKYGTDATRLSLLLGNTPGNDMKLSEEKIAGFRNFTNKLWNISRFMLLNIENPQIDVGLPKLKTDADKWIISKLSSLILNVSKNIEEYNFSYAGEQLRDFTWNELADWYLEVAKIEKDKSEVLNFILNALLKLWHPFMPFVTEAIWNEVYPGDKLIMIQKWPKCDVVSSSDFEIIIEIVNNIRMIRNQYAVEPSKKVDLEIATNTQQEILNRNAEVIIGLGRLNNFKIVSTEERKTNGSAALIFLTKYDCEIRMPHDGLVDAEKEKSRISKELEEAQKYGDVLENKLSNEQFVNNAPEAVVRVEKEKLQAQKEKIEKLQNQLKTLI